MDTVKKKKIVCIITILAIVCFIFVFFFVIRPFFSLWTGNYGVYISTYNIENFEIPEGTTRINENAFKDCDTLVSITIPSSVKYIGEHAFDGCDNLEKVHIGDIGAWCSIEFQSTGSGVGNPLQRGNLYLNGTLVRHLVIPNGVTKIEDYAFYGYDTLSSIVIPSSVRSIGKSAFSACKNLTDVTLSEGLKTIEENAFCNCKKLTKIIIPKSVTNINGGDVLDEPFFRCSNLTLYCRATAKPYGWTGNWDVYDHRNLGKENLKLKVVWGYMGD